MLGEPLRAAGDPMTTAEVQPYDVAAFAATLSGTVIRPDDDEYAAARRVWNGSIDRYPSLIVRPRTPEDVALAIALARRQRLPLAVRGGGHNVAGSGTCDTGIVLDLVEMTEVVVDTELSTIRAGGGCTWAQVDKAAGASARHPRRPHLEHRGRRPDARRRHRLAEPQARLHERQPDRGRARHRRRRDRAGWRRQPPGPLLGPPRGWWELRCRHRLHLPRTPGQHRPRRADAVPRGPGGRRARRLCLVGAHGP